MCHKLHKTHVEQIRLAILQGNKVPGGLVITGLLSLTLVTVTEMVAVPVRGGAASSTAITCIHKHTMQYELYEVLQQCFCGQRVVLQFVLHC